MKFKKRETQNNIYSPFMVKRKKQLEKCPCKMMGRKMRKNKRFLKFCPVFYVYELLHFGRLK